MFHGLPFGLKIAAQSVPWFFFPSPHPILGRPIGPRQGYRVIVKSQIIKLTLWSNEPEVM